MVESASASMQPTERATEPAAGTPLHQQVTAALLAQIERGELPIGAMLPPEVELAHQFGVSRHTMRAGLDALVRAGLIERQRGRGTVVVRPRIQQSLRRFYSVAREMRERGMDLVTRVLARGCFAADDVLGLLACEHLGLTHPEQVGYLLRLRLLEDEPLMLEYMTFPLALCPALIELPAAGAIDSATLSFYDVLASQTGIRVTAARETFRPVAAGEEDAEQLGVASGTPVFEVERTGYQGERTVEWRRSLVRGDRYSFAIDLANPSEADEYPAPGERLPTHAEPPRFFQGQAPTLTGNEMQCADRAPEGGAS